MNERIRELAEQAWVYQVQVYQDNGVRTYGEQEKVFDKEKFAELIIRECMDVVDTGENQVIARYQARQWLAEHFEI